ncbi:MAG TPA: efflux RND transporter periplasmic adaptor subunit [Steroidobacteraceae bacterium]|nr:efflux RND transporter periplasmic adaptor subunit [Steroidobacteraceae bacterium]HQW10091.1 efflux RND transporter periplasmic adaptor subunit [Steroidobacteraceae bacterium]HQX45927.1 efflux RND transporter periplasmic adaptor subunit [Steroidobacteraceae bacterium]HQX77168.1 efflux RND transporter periplasmic adaptor subunit [Steroidobacteraceae bacterium]HQZ79795.1 efflux RND transporter periplasmic adaptor subunit [Steroidobacteraceae bacterium]
MADTRNVVTAASLVAALLAGGWAIYATKHAGAPIEAPRAGVGARPGGAAPVVVSAVVRSERVSHELKALGTAIANESIEVMSKTSNFVSAVRFRDGETVKHGQILIELDPAQARADLAEASAALTESTSQYERARDLLSTRVVSQSQYEQLEATMKANQARADAATARLADTVIRAPFGGRVGLRRVSVGSLASPGTVITTLDDTSVMKVDFAVPENLLGSLREGLELSARTAAHPDSELKGRVLTIDSRIDPVTRSVTVRALVPNAASLLRPGMLVNVTLARDEYEALVIPEQALVPEQSRQYVFVVDGDSKVARREVQIGRREPGKVEIVGGLAQGERIVVEGTQKLHDGIAVREAQG